MSISVTRRTLLGTLAAGAAVTALPATASEPRSPIKGNIKQAVSRWCYGSIPMPDFLKACKRMGIVGIDLVGPDEWPIIFEHGLVPSMVPGAGGIANGCNNPEIHERLLNDFEINIPRAAKHQIRNVITFSGNRNGLPDDVGMENCAKLLKKAAKVAENEGVIICMELLNSKVDHADYMCDHTLWGVELCKMVGSPNFKLLYDIYHMQIMEGDIIRTIRDYNEYVGHYHTGGNPGRNEIDSTQELYYPPIMQAILDTGFDGYVAHEFVPAREDKLASLQQAVGICDV